MDDFEQRLKRQPLRQPPAGWRDEILRECRESTVESRRPERSFLSTLNHQLSTLLWPHPKAWAGLAAAWVVIAALNLSMREPGPASVKKGSPSPETMAELKRQRLLYAQLMGPNEQPVDRPKTFVPQPRSGRAWVTMT